MKRLISLLLALTMLISLLPATLIFAAGSENDVIIDFNELADGADTAALNTNAADRPYTFNTTDGLGNWIKRTPHSASILRNEVVTSGGGWPTSTNKNRKAAIDIEIPANGYYSISFKGGVSSFGCDASIYIAGKYVGDYSFYANNSKARGHSEPGEEKKLNTVYLTKGTNTITFNARNEYPDPENYPNVYMFFHNLSFIYVGETAPTLSEAIETTLPAEIAKGNTEAYTATVKMSDGSSLYLGDYLSNGTADTGNYLSVTSEDSGIVEVTNVTKGGYANSEKTSYTVRGKAPGEVNLVYTLYLNGTEAETWKRSVKVNDSNDVIIDFNELADGADTAALNTNAADRPYTFNTTDGLGNWIKRTPHSASILRNEVVTSDGGWPTSTNKNRKAAIDIEIPANGYYSISFKGGVSSFGCDASIYIAGKYVGDYSFYANNSKARGHSEPGEEKKLNTVYLTKGTNTITFNARNEYPDPDNYPNVYMFFHTLTIDYLEDVNEQTNPTLTAAELETKLPAKAMPIGNSEAYTATVKMSDGSSLYLGDYLSDGKEDTVNYLSIESENKEVAEVTEVKKGGYANSEKISYIVNAKTAGKTNLVYTLYLGGEVAGTWKKPIETTDSFDVIADFSTCSIGGTTATTKPPEGAPFSFNTKVGTIEWRNNNTQGNVLRTTMNINVWPEKSDQWNVAAIDMEVPVSGYYSVRFKGGLAAVSSKTSIFVGDKYVGDYDFSTSNITTANAVNSLDGEEKTLNTVWLEAGTNTFMFRSRSAHDPASSYPNNTYLFFKKLSLIYVETEALTPAGVETNLPEKLTKGIAVTSTAKVKMSDGSTLSIGDYNYDRTEATATRLEVTSDKPDVVEVRSYAKGGLCNAENTSYKLIPKKADTATLTYTLYRDGNVAGTWTKSVTVEETGNDDVIIDFDTCIVGNPAAPLDGAPYSFNTTAGAVEWRNDNTANNTVRAALDKNKLWPASSGEDGTAAIDVTAPKSGYYSVKLKGALSGVSGKVSIYAGEEYIGDYDFTSADEATNNAVNSTDGEEKTLNTVYLKEGTNTITFRLRSSHELEAFPDSAYLFFKKLSFIYIGADAPTAAEIDAALPSAGQITGMLLDEVTTATATVKMSDGSVLYLGDYLSSGAADTANYLSVTSDKPEIVEVSELKKGGICNSENTSYTLTAKSAGTAVLTYTLYLDGAEAGKWTEEFTALPEMQKTEPTIYTYEMRENAQENVSKYAWARELKDTAVKSADQYLENLDAIYDMIIGEGLPRSMTAAMIDDPSAYSCVYCGKDLREQYNAYAWGIDPINHPWKMQCVYCKRRFPSNDFGSFFELGHIPEGYYNEEHGTTEFFDRTLALENHRQMLLDKGIDLPSEDTVNMTDERRAEIRDTGDLLTKEEQAYYGYGVEGGYLYNDSCRNAAKDGVIVKNAVYDADGKLVEPEIRVTDETLDTFAVDDGWGWDTGEKASTGVPIRKGFVAFYNFSVWSYGSPNRYITKALDSLRDAYLYTGDIKYGRAGAILIDRVADVYPSYKWDIHFDWQHSHGGWTKGKIDGNLWERQLAHCFARAYDAFWPAMDDEQVISYLSAKAEELGLSNKKLTGDMIRRNSEDNICREIFKEAKNGRIVSNFPNHQSTVILAAIALDSMPDTQEMFDWMHIPSSKPTHKVTRWGKTFYMITENTGGQMMTEYIDKVDRDGFAEEVSQLYNQGRLTQSLEIAEAIKVYEDLKGYDVGLDFYNSPKFQKMFYAIFNMTMAGNYTVQIGDEYGTAGIRNNTDEKSMLYGMERLGDMSFAQRYWTVRNGDMSRAYISIFEKDAGELAKKIENYVKENGEIKLPSQNLAGYGLAVLRDGERIKGSGAKDLRRDTWMWYGRSDAAHGHRDTLQMGVDAYGFNFTPDLGYPPATSYDPNRLQWVANTLSHNTVVVNGNRQNQIRIGEPLHFEDAGTVGVIDVEAPQAYNETDIYRRTLVTVEVAEGDAYTVDFFRVRGGNEHIYSFHTQSFNGVTVDGLELTAQDGGTYAGEGTTYGKDPNTQDSNNYETMYPRGYTWLRNVRRDESPENAQFSVNFEQTDFNKQLSDPSGLNLKWTALNDWTPSSVGFATAETPNLTHNKNIPELDYMLVHRKSDDSLDTLFTSVIQPYKGEEYIESMASVPVLLGENAVGDNGTKAIRVTLKSGRTDYIVYSVDNTKTYTISDTLTNAAGEEIPVSFDFKGFVGVYSVNESGANIYSYVNDGSLIGDTTAEASVSGKVVDFTRELSSENSMTVKLDSEADLENLVGRYIYVDNAGDRNGAYKIEGAAQSGENVVLDLGDVTLIKQYRDITNLELGYLYNIAEGDSFVIPLSVAEDSSPVVGEVQGNLTTSAGSSINVTVSAESPVGEKITYVGTHLPRGASIDSATGTITWKPTASQVGDNTFVITARDESGRESSIVFDVTVYGSTSGGGGGGGGDTTATPAVPDDKEDEKPDETTTPDETTKPDEGTTGETEEVRFIDLGNHAWAESSINSLADEGVIKGTTHNTYSPANNITRADYAVLLVRAFEQTSDNTENFDDVLDTDYFASEIAIARNTGIVEGIGENKFAPRNNITRQDMMVMTYRALVKLGIELETGEVTAPDMDEVSDYAKEAVTALMSSGLINGKDGYIDPKTNTTRAEVAVLLRRILDYVK